MNKTTQAWGWLTAGVLAAGMNASYHNGGLQWVHEVADRLEGNSQAVFALASGQAQQVLSEARFLTRPNETAACPLATSMARVQSKIDRSQATFDRIEALSDRQQARWEANQARMEARIAAQTAHLRIVRVCSRRPQSDPGSRGLSPGSRQRAAATEN